MIGCLEILLFRLLPQGALPWEQIILSTIQNCKKYSFNQTYACFLTTNTRFLPLAFSRFNDSDIVKWYQVKMMIHCDVKHVRVFSWKKYDSRVKEWELTEYHYGRLPLVSQVWYPCVKVIQSIESRLLK